MRTFILASLMMPCVGLGQSFNIDLDISAGGPEVGHGVPSDSFGAAANQPGRWNRYPATGTGRVPIPLLDVYGNATSVTFWASNVGGAGGGWNNPLNTELDFQLLLHDVANLINGPITWTFDGLATGLYTLFAYAVSPVPAHREPLPTEVFVNNSLSQNPQIVTGPMPGNNFGYQITHSIHDVFVTDGQIQITVTGVDPDRISKVNGFQLVAVPEPGTLLIFASSAFWFLTLRRRPTRR